MNRRILLMEDCDTLWRLLPRARWLAPGAHPVLQRGKAHQARRDFSHAGHPCPRFTLPGRTPWETRSTCQRSPSTVLAEEGASTKMRAPAGRSSSCIALFFRHSPRCLPTDDSSLALSWVAPRDVSSVILCQDAARSSRRLLGKPLGMRSTAQDRTGDHTRQRRTALALRRERAWQRDGWLRGPGAQGPRGALCVGMRNPLDNVAQRCDCEA